MQAPGRACGQGCPGHGGHTQAGESSHPKKGNLSSSRGCNEARLAFHDANWDSVAQEQMADDKEISPVDKTDFLEPPCAASPGADRETAFSPSTEPEDSIDYVFLNETYSIRYPESKLKDKSLILVNAELESEMQAREEVCFDLLEHKVNKMIGFERSYEISDDDDKEAAEEAQRWGADEDSQQEYQSAEEQEHRSSLLSWGQAEAAHASHPEVTGLRDSGCGVKRASSLEVNHVKLESRSSISLDSIDVHGQEDSPYVSTFQNSVTFRECHKPKHEKLKEQEPGVIYHTLFDKIVPRKSLPENQEFPSHSSLLNPQQALNTKVYTGKFKYQVTETKGFCGNATVENKMSHVEKPSVLPQDKASGAFLQHCEDNPACGSPACDDSVAPASEHLHYKSLPNTPTSTLDGSMTPPRTGVGDNQVVEADCSLRGTAREASLHSVAESSPEPRAAAAKGAVTVNQTVDVSADFRACFTTSRATSARPAVVSTSSNTEITMMNKKRPGECQKGRQRSVACNTYWSCCGDHEDTQVAVMKGYLGESTSVNSLKPNGNFLKDSVELRKIPATTDLKKHPERQPQLSKDLEKNSPSKCCQKILQRAIKAELHLLNVHYQMCHHHCSDIYKLVMENRDGSNGNLSTNPMKKELGSALLSVLGDLKVKYVSLKEKINQGIPLEELPPLSVESKLLSTFSTFASKLVKKELHVFSGADSEVDNQSIHDVDISSSLKKTLSQVSLSSGNSHPYRGTPPEENSSKNGDIDGYFSQLKLDDEDDKSYQAASEDWFDARESPTGAECSGVQARLAEQGGRPLQCTLEIKNVESLQRDKGYLVHVGGLCSSVSEADLRYHFQKYQVSEISIYDSSNYRYATLALKTSSDAKSAVKEVNGTEINGKPVNVRLVKSPGECTSPLASRSGRRVAVTNLEKGSNKEVSSASCVSRWPRTRPRQLGSEEDSEFFHLEQGVKKKNCKQIEYTKQLPDTPVRFMPPNTLNLRSFTKIMKRLAELHPDLSKEHIIDALQIVRINHKGFLNGLSINAIVEMTSSILRNSASS